MTRYPFSGFITYGISSAGIKESQLWEGFHPSSNPWGIAFLLGTAPAV